MDCEQAQLLIAPSILGDAGLDVPSRLRLESHLAECPPCRAAYRDCDRVIRYLQAMPADLIERALGRPGPHSPTLPSRRLRMPLLIRRITAVAACVGLIAAAGMGFRFLARPLASPESGSAGDVETPTRSDPLLMGQASVLTLGGDESDPRPFFAGEKITSAADQRLRMRILNRHDLTLEPNSTLLSRPTPHGGCEVELSSGSVKISVHRGAGEGRFRVLTPHALLTVTGTVFAVSVDAGRTHLTVTQGTVELAPRNVATGTGPTVQAVAAGQAVSTDGFALQPVGPGDVDSVLAADDVVKNPATMFHSEWYQSRFAPLLRLRDHLAGRGIVVDESTLLAISADPWCIQYPKGSGGSVPPFIYRKAGLDRAARFFGYRVHWLAPADASEAAGAISQAQAAGAIVLSYQSPAHIEVPDPSGPAVLAAWAYRFLGEEAPTPWAMCILTGSTLPDEAERERLRREALADMSRLLGETADCAYFVGLAALDAWADAPTSAARLGLNDPFLGSFRLLAQLGASAPPLEGRLAASTSTLIGGQVHSELNRWLEAALALPEPGTLACEREAVKAAAGDAAAILQRAADHATAQLRSAQ